MGWAGERCIVPAPSFLRFFPFSSHRAFWTVDCKTILSQGIPDKAVQISAHKSRVLLQVPPRDKTCCPAFTYSTEGSSRPPRRSQNCLSGPQGPRPGVSVRKPFSQNYRPISSNITASLQTSHPPQRRAYSMLSCKKYGGMPPIILNFLRSVPSGQVSSWRFTTQTQNQTPTGVRVFRSLRHTQSTSKEKTKKDGRGRPGRAVVIKE